MKMRRKMPDLKEYRPTCRYCGKVIETWEAKEEIIARRGTKIYIHTKCVEAERGKRVS